MKKQEERHFRATMCSGGSLIDQGVSMRLLDALWKEMVS